MAEPLNHGVSGDERAALLGLSQEPTYQQQKDERDSRHVEHPADATDQSAPSNEAARKGAVAARYFAGRGVRERTGH